MHEALPGRHYSSTASYKYYPNSDWSVPAWKYEVSTIHEKVLKATLLITKNT